MGTPGSDKTWGCCALQRSPPLALLLSFLLGLWELQARSLNAARRSGLGTPSTPFSLMTPSLGEFQSGVSTIASTLPLAPLNPSSALQGENCQLSVGAVGMDLDLGKDLGMVSHQCRSASS